MKTLLEIINTDNEPNIIEQIMSNEDKIKQKHPEAVCEQDGAMFFIVINTTDGGKKDIGTGTSAKEAWTSAFQKKLTSKKL